MENAMLHQLCNETMLDPELERKLRAENVLAPIWKDG